MKDYLLYALMFYFSFSLLSCGFHEQELKRKAVITISKDTTEKDPLKLLFSAVRSGDLEKIKFLITNENVSLDSHDSEQGLTLLMTAVEHKQLGVIEFLVNMNVNLDLKSNGKRIKPAVDVFGFIDLLHGGKPQLLNDQDVEIVKAIINKESFDATRLNKLQFDSITFFNFQLVNWLLNKGSDPNALNSKKRTALIEYMKKNGVVNIPRSDFNGKIVCTNELRRQWLSSDLYSLFRVFDTYILNPDYKPDLVVGSKKRPSSLLDSIKTQIHNKNRPEYKELLNKYNCRVHGSAMHFNIEGDSIGQNIKKYTDCSELHKAYEIQRIHKEKLFCQNTVDSCIGEACCFSEVGCKN